MPRTRIDISPRFRSRPTSLLLALAAALVLLCAVSASAGASSSIEGVWEFEHGEIAVQQMEGATVGTLEGVVVQTTTFAECAHAEGEKIWKDMTPQPDGSYTGDHQWLFENTCVKNEVQGPTAWRVEEEAGRRYLRVCFSSPGTTQPEIPASGPETGVTYKCIDSKLTAALPVVAGSGTTGGSTPPGTPASGVAGERLSLPSAKQCLSGRLFKIHLAEPKYDPFKTVAVTIRGHKIATVHRGNYVIATINLKGLPRGAFTVKIHATTVLGHNLSSSRTYHTCAKKRR
jgi:hypothetical protein